MSYEVTDNQYCRGRLIDGFPVYPRNKMRGVPPIWPEKPVPMTEEDDIQLIAEGEVHWFPLRIANSSQARQKRLENLFQSEECVEATYVPMEYVKVSPTKMAFVPSLLNYIFVRTTLRSLMDLKHSNSCYDQVRYTMHPVYDKNCRKLPEKGILYVPDAMMHDFMRVVSADNDKVIFLDNLDYACKPSQPVQIVEGEFAGITGRIKRIKGNTCVVLPIGNILAAAITGIPRKILRYLSEEDLEGIEN